MQLRGSSLFVALCLHCLQPVVLVPMRPREVEGGVLAGAAAGAFDEVAAACLQTPAVEYVPRAMAFRACR